ncbi:hypothetical protein H6771_02440 [Candidatus Peribacteria bacterium]|nr:hypothetical protein [Candidatus Peribacteria bacterium]
MQTPLPVYEAFRTQCQRAILQMLEQSQSGHPGGSLSSLDILCTLYLERILPTGEAVIISNGHISPGVYSVLAGLRVFPLEELIAGFRHDGSRYEGHITRHVPGVWYGTGPLGIGASVGCGIAIADERDDRSQRTWVVVGDGECQEGQLHEMALFARKYALGQLTVLVDGNAVQLSGSLQRIMPTPVQELFLAHGWDVTEVNGHDPIGLCGVIAAPPTGQPRLVYCHTVMGRGIPTMEREGEAHHSTWHGKAPSTAQVTAWLAELPLPDPALLAQVPQLTQLPPSSTALQQAQRAHPVQLPTVPHSPAGTVTDCRSAYGQTLLMLAQQNPQVMALTADLSESVKMDALAEQLPEQFIECGICEQHMMSTAAGLSLRGKVPFVSTFGAFATSRAKDQARVNDINQMNVKVVATHCGLSVGKDGPTHQAIDDMGAMSGHLHTQVLSPADANHCAHLTRYAAQHYGPVYMRMGRHQFAVLTDTSGRAFYTPDYQYTYGKCDLLRQHTSSTVVVCVGATAREALDAYERLGMPASIVVTSSPRAFDHTLLQALQGAEHILTVEDHNPYTGLGGGLSHWLLTRGIRPQRYTTLGVREYQLSGEAKELYARAGIDAQSIARAVTP